MRFVPHFKGRRIIPGKLDIPFMRYRDLCFVLSIVAMLAAIALLATRGLNFGVDFKGGSLVEIQSKSGPADIAALRDKIGGLGLGDVQIQQFGAPTDALIRIEQQPGGEVAQQETLKRVMAAVGAGYEQRRAEVVGPAVSGELRTTGTIAVLASILAIVAYVWFRFEWQFAAGTVVALAHDVLVTVGLFSLFQLEFDLAIVAALLTILGYSVNDTVVVSDRIRENLRKYKKMDISQLINLSINETLSRTLMTSVTTLAVLTALYIWGGEVIRNFTFAMLFGIIIGTYSSIFIAAPILAYLGLPRDTSAAGAATSGAAPAADATKANS